VKRFEANWILQSFQEYLASGGNQCGNPWKEIMFSEWLKQHGQGHQVLTAESVAFHEASTDDVLVMCPMVPDCDLFEKCQKLGRPGSEREANALSVLKALVRSLFCMHEMDVAHGKIKAESVWLQEAAWTVEGFEVLFSDFGHNDQERSPCTPPEVTTDSTYDNKASDLFACGVLGYCLATGSYPWLSTVPGTCKAFDFARQHGVRPFLARGLRKYPRAVSAQYEEILTALLEINPGERVRMSKHLMK
jgi:serine/threonine protein kinase